MKAGNRLKENDPENKVRTGAAVFTDTINDLDISYLFGHTGGAIMPMYVELNERVNRKEKTPQVILFRHEQGAGHAAEGYAKITGKPGFVCVTSGPASTNIVTPIADAFMDSIPVIFVTGQVSSPGIGTDAFQEVPITLIVSQITKIALLIKTADEIEGALRLAHELTTTGRKGPVLIDICRDALIGTETPENHKVPFAVKMKKAVDDFDKAAIDEMLGRFAAAKRPMLYVGGGIKVEDSQNLLRRFAKKYDTPVGMTLMSLGTIDRKDRLSLGMLGIHGTVEANYSALNADCILAIGARFDDRVAVKGFGKNARIIAHVDIDPAEINKIRKVDYSINTSAKKFLEYALKHGPERTESLTEWHVEIAKWKKSNPKLDDDKDVVVPQRFIKELSDLTSGDAVVATGVGQHQMWTAQYYEFKNPKDFLTSGGLGTMGCGLPAAIGAYYANKDREVLLIDGDGSFQMNIQELATVAANRIPVKMFVLNNGLWGLPMQWHEMFDRGNLFECCLDRSIECPVGCSSFKDCVKRSRNPDLVALSDVYPGIKTKRISRPEEVTPAIKEALAYKGPYLLDVEIKKESYILPIIPPRAGIDEMITEVKK
ncbi:MAG TPA: biosynthetic-type acetolactate synthase large subunit [Syntrophales bacterium]|nr:biosynthetic-type acetolactate synthase large subunit [Syntrophales bacterium]